MFHMDEDKFVKDYKTCLFIGEGRKKPVCVLDDYGDLLAAIMPYDTDREDGREWQQKKQSQLLKRKPRSFPEMSDLILSI